MRLPGTPAYLHCSLHFHKPAPQHGLHLAVGQLGVGVVDFLLDQVLQQEAPQPPVEEGAGCFPIQDVL